MRRLDARHSAGIMTETGSASDMSDADPSAAAADSKMAEQEQLEEPAPFVIRQNGDSDIAALDLTEQSAFVTSQDGASGMADLDPAEEPAPSGRQTGDEPAGDQPTDDDLTGDINEEKLIAEVQKCPRIYGEDFSKYYNKVTSEKQWLNICERLFPEWKTFSPRKMKEIAIRVQKNWAKLRKPLFKKHLKFFGEGRKNSAANQIKINAALHSYIEKLAGLIGEQLLACEDYALDKQPNPQEAPQEDIQNNSSATSSTSIQNFKVPLPNVEPATPSTSAQNYKVPFPNVEPAIPSTSTHNDQPENIADDFPSNIALPDKMSQFFPFVPGVIESISSVKRVLSVPTISAHISPNTNEGKYDDSIPPETGLYKNPELANALYSMLTHLDYDQQRAVWPKLVDLITEAQLKPKKIKVLQSELLINDKHSRIFVAATEPELILQGPFAESDQVVQETYAEPELVPQETLAASELTGQETLVETEQPEPEEAEEEPIYPCSYGRPTNAQGEIMYPETDQEDLDEE